MSEARGVREGRRGGGPRGKRRLGGGRGVSSAEVVFAREACFVEEVKVKARFFNFGSRFV